MRYTRLKFETLKKTNFKMSHKRSPVSPYVKKKKILSVIPILSILPLEIQPLTFTHVVPRSVFRSAGGWGGGWEKMRGLRIISREQILPLARARLIFLKAASSIRIKPPAGSRKPAKHKSARRSARRFVRRSGGGRVAAASHSLTPSLPPSPVWPGLAVNETLPGSVSLTTPPPLSHHHYPPTHLC